MAMTYSGKISTAKSCPVGAWTTIVACVTASVIFGAGAVGQEASIDRASLVLGHFPRDTTT